MSEPNTPRDPHEQEPKPDAQVPAQPPTGAGIDQGSGAPTSPPQQPMQPPQPPPMGQSTFAGPAHAQPRATDPSQSQPSRPLPPTGAALPAAHMPPPPGPPGGYPPPAGPTSASPYGSDPYGRAAERDAARARAYGDQPVPVDVMADAGGTGDGSMPPSGSGDGRPPRKNGSGGWGKAVVAGIGGALVAVLVTGALFVWGPWAPAESSNTSAQTSPLVSANNDGTPDWQTVANEVSDTVVSITVLTNTGGDQGSGVVYDAKGDILTNNHVIEAAVDGGGSISVTLANGNIYKASIVGRDTSTDLAIIRLQNPPSDLTVARLGDSDKVKVGDPVMADGNPLGLASTITTGTISALNRPVAVQDETTGVTQVTNAIQLDAAINPGNSGGAAFNENGEVIGINSTIATLDSSSSSSQSGSIGLGFAIPINTAKMIADQLVANGTAQHSYLGVGLTTGSATVDGTTTAGAAVGSITAGGPADKAGIQVGDVITEFDGVKVNSQESLMGLVRAEPVGAKVKMTYVRDGKSAEVEVTLEQQPPGYGSPTTPGQGGGGGSTPFDPFGLFGGGGGSDGSDGSGN